VIWFPKIGDALECRVEPGGVWSVVGVRREGPTRDRSWELFEVAILCVVQPTGPYVVTQLGRTYHIRGSLPYIQWSYPCLTM